MSDQVPSTDLPMPLTARPTTRSDRAALERLWLLFRHDMSAVNGDLPRADGSYRSERLEHVLSGTPGWLGWILTAADRPLGFAIVRALDQPVRVINSFFVVAAARRCGTGSAFARAVVSSHPGRWTVAHQDRNSAAARFWPAVAAALDLDWTSAYQPVPGQPDAPPDPQALLRSRSYVKLLVLAALVGVPVSGVSYGFLALVDWLQGALFDDLPTTLGFDAPPTWWPLPLLAVGGLLAALAIRTPENAASWATGVTGFVFAERPAAATVHPASE
jgi:predicted acetyltransferase